MKTEELFFIIRIEVQTGHENINDTLQEMEKQSRFLMTDTPSVKVMNAEILTTKMRNKNN
ncbi:hypothetical protein EA772_01525 [Pedobacter sp. G11]|uniref:hypothetical protein n=1 Tax=Pedobacter sp. G11 TaxID=2482728 RepID=UPI000F5F7FF6|nr:hypothetical protein [Pedobacter sp. G11]AZI24086.1 hypothetical protein EA772_01525 [Pedobacter sp. G11]